MRSIVRKILFESSTTLLNLTLLLFDPDPRSNHPSPPTQAHRQGAGTIGRKERLAWRIGTGSAVTLLFKVRRKLSWSGMNQCLSIVSIIPSLLSAYRPRRLISSWRSPPLICPNHSLGRAHAFQPFLDIGLPPLLCHSLPSRH